MAATGGSATNAVIIERLEALRCDLVEIKTTVNSLAGDYQRFREGYATEHIKVVQSAETAHRRIDKIERDLQKLEEQIRPLVVWGRVAAFIASALGISLIGLIWSLITGQVSLVFP